MMNKVIVVGVGLVSLGGAAMMLAARGDGDRPTPLSVEQTLGLVVTRFEDAPSIHLYARSNPAAAGPLRRILADDALKEHHSNAWVSLGFIGDASDVPRIAASFARYEGVLDPADRLAVRAMIHALGRLCGRDIEGACELLDWMEDIESWREAKFRLHDRPRPIPPELDGVIYAMMADAYSERPGLEARVRAFLEGIEDRDVREHVARNVDPEQIESIARTVRFAAGRAPAADVLQALERTFRDHAAELRPVMNGHAENGADIEPPAQLDRGADEGAIQDTPSDIAVILRDQYGVDGIELDRDGEVTHLVLAGPKITDEAIGLAARLPKLRSLTVASAPITDAGLARLAAARMLQRLDLSGCERITDRGLACLERLEHLRYLGLAHLPRVTDAGLAHAEGLRELWMVNLRGLEVTDAALSFLRGKEDLERLYLYDVPITGEGLRHVEGLEKLEILVLRGTRLNDAGLRYLEKLPGLRQVILGMTTSDSYRDEVTQAGLERLRRALPKCEVRR